MQEKEKVSITIYKIYDRPWKKYAVGYDYITKKFTRTYIRALLTAWYMVYHTKKLKTKKQSKEVWRKMIEI